jgi:dTDP-D-glucose 4,6-dehydratase
LADPYREVISQRRNLHVVETICDLHRRLISFVADRPGHDGKPAYRNGRFVAWGASIGE